MPKNSIMTRLGSLLAYAVLSVWMVSSTMAEEPGQLPPVPPPLPLLSGNIGPGKTPYITIKPTEYSTDDPHVILLHGNSYTKDTWKDSGILEMFRKSHPSVAITALDLPIAADHQFLKNVLNAMDNAGIIKQLPVTLVTPSASGYTVTSWITQEAAGGLSEYISTWIPVASYGVLDCTTDDLKTLSGTDVKVLAINGDQDTKGKMCTADLAMYAGAEPMEFPGGHSFYLDQQAAFVKTVGLAARGISAAEAEAEAAAAAATQKPSTPALLSGTIGGSNSGYYHQKRTIFSNQNLVLLHANTLSMENWTESGIMEMFRDNNPELSITALNLPIAGNYKTLKATLEALQDEGLINLPISALVTPSASGYSVTSWITEEAAEGLKDYILTWIPVASSSVGDLKPEDYTVLQYKNSKVRTLSINGDKDVQGKMITADLALYGGAKTLELPGGHHVYLESPEPFVTAVGKAIDDVKSQTDKFIQDDPTINPDYFAEVTMDNAVGAGKPVPELEETSHPFDECLPTKDPTTQPVPSSPPVARPTAKPSVFRRPTTNPAQVFVLDYESEDEASKAAAKSSAFAIGATIVSRLLALAVLVLPWY